MLKTPHVYGVAADKPYYAENLVEEIDQSGEYYVDRANGVLYWWPPTGTDDETLIQLSTLAVPLLLLDGASHVTFQDPTLEATRGDAVRIKGGTGVRIAGCTLRNLGNRAVVEGGTDHAVVGCDIFQTGEGGISLTGGDRPTLVPSGHLADNNHIHHFSRRGLTYRPAISLNGVGCRAAHNLIHDTPHSAILFWGNDHVIEYNEIHHVLSCTGDGGAVYTGRDWTFRGNVIRYNFFHDLMGVRVWENAVYIDDQAGGMQIYGNIVHNCHWGMLIGGGRDNVIHDIDSYSYGGWGLYTDEGSTGILMESNLVYDTKTGGFHQHYDRDNIVRNNIFAFSRLYQLQCTRVEDHRSFTFENNIVYWDAGALLSGPWTKVNIEMDHNCHWHARGADFDFAGLSREQWQEAGRDAHSVVAGPGFSDPAARAFCLADDSPARGIGFEPFDFARAGVYGSPDWVAKARSD